MYNSFLERYIIRNPSLYQIQGKKAIYMTLTYNAIIRV